MPVYEEVLEIAHNNVQQLGNQLSELNDLKKLLRDAREIPDQWDEKFKEVAATTSEYTAAINALANTYLEGSNEVIGNNLAELASANAKLGTQIQALTTYDFASHFKTLQQEIAEQVKADLRKEIEGVSVATGELGTTNETFRQEIQRLHEVDLEAHFNRHQKMLSDVFNAINSINSLLSTNMQTLVQLQAGQAEVQSTLEVQHKELLIKVADNAAAVGRLRGINIINLIITVIAVLLLAYLAFAK
jgi:phage-related protein